MVVDRTGTASGFGRLLAFFADHNEAAEAWSHCIDVNFKGVLNGICAVHDQMIARGAGHIVNLSSIYANYPVRGAAVYGATKAAVSFMSEAPREWTHPDSIKYLGLAPEELAEQILYVNVPCGTLAL